MEAAESTKNLMFLHLLNICKNQFKSEATRVAVGECDVIQKKVVGTLFDTVGVVEWSYGKFGEFVVESFIYQVIAECRCKRISVKENRVKLI